MRATRLYLIAGIPALISMLGCSTGSDTPGQAAVVAPTITVHPAAQSIIAGQNASFSVTATGTSISYQWRRSTDGGTSFTDVAGATNATLALTAVPLADNAHQFRVMVSNSAGSVTSSAASLTVSPAPMIPAFTTQPLNTTVTAPNSATFNVAATGFPSPTLQWQWSTNSGSSFTDIASATTNSYTTAVTSIGDNGNQYRAIATNGSGSTTSTVATLTINAPGPKAWGTAAAIETNAAGIYSASPQIGIDANGNVLAVFAQWDGTRKNIMANRYSAASNTWGTAVLIETDNAGDAIFPQIAIDASGNALAVWQQSDGTRNNIWANRYTAANNTWGTAVLIETDNAGHANLPQIAMDPSGNALAVWQQSDGTRTHIWANRYTAGTGWGTAARIETDAGMANTPQIAMDANGHGLAVWAQDAGSVTHIMANRYTAGTTNTWGTAASIATFTQGAGGNAQIAINASGNAMVVWEQNDYPEFNIAANRYTAATNTWGTAQVIETEPFATRNPQIAMDTDGNALAVWEHLDGVYSLAANRYTSTSNTWGTATLIETNDTGNVSVPRIAFDASGNALAVWQQGDGALQNIWSNRYTVGFGWGTAALIETSNAGNAYDPHIAVYTNGNALAVWGQNEGSSSSNIWANRFQ